MTDQTAIDQTTEAEASGTYSKEVLFDRKTYQHILRKQITIEPHEGFRKHLLDIFKRRNVQYFDTNVQEFPIPRNLADGQVELPLIPLDQIKKKLKDISGKDRPTIGYIHFGAVRIQIKASFQKGIDTPIMLTLMHNRIRQRKDAIIGILKGNLIYQNLAFTLYPGFGIPIKDLDTSRALNLCYKFDRTDLLESLHQSPFTIYVMVSYTLCNTHIIDRFLDKDYIEINDIFSDACQEEPLARSCMISTSNRWTMDIQSKPLFNPNSGTTARYSVDGTTLRSYSQDRITRSLLPPSTNYQLVTKIYIATWQDGLIWINPAAQHNYAGTDLFPKITEHKLTYVPILLNSIERIIHLENQPFPTKADLLLGIKFLAETTYTITDKYLTIKINGVILQATQIHD